MGKFRLDFGRLSWYNRAKQANENEVPTNCLCQADDTEMRICYNNIVESWPIPSGRLFNFIVERLLKMKYCTHCGAALPDSAVSFCPECGKSLPESTVEKPAKEKKKKAKPVKTKTHPKKAKKSELPIEDDYDGYYDDRLPIDESHRRDGMDKHIIKKVAALILCLLVVIGACVAILYVI